MIFTRQDVLIVGASSGIGWETARVFRDAGWKVTATIRQGSALEGVRAVSLDVRDREAINNVVQGHVDEHGGLGAMVWAAGITRDALLIRMSDEELDEVLDVNLRAPIVGMRAAIRPMLRQREGSIVLVSSYSARWGVPGQVNYTASKGGLEAAVRSASKEYGKKGIRINAIAPGPTDTPMLAAVPDKEREQMLDDIPLKRAVKPEEVAAAIFAITNLTAVTAATLPVGAGY